MLLSEAESEGDAMSIDYEGTNRFETAYEDERPVTHPSVTIASHDDFDAADFKDYTEYANIVEEVLSFSRGTDAYRVLFRDGHFENHPAKAIRQLEGGIEALEDFLHRDRDYASDESDMSLRRPGASRPLASGFVPVENALDFLSSSDDQTSARKRKADEAGFDSGDDLIIRRKSRRHASSDNHHRVRILRHSNVASSDEDTDDDDDDLLISDVVTTKKKSKQLKLKLKHGKTPRIGERQSGRTTRHTGTMYEHVVDGDSDDVQVRQQPAPVPKAKGAREVFKDLPKDNAFRKRHMQQCESCGNNATSLPLIYCQGCTLAYHKHCLRDRSSRDHLVTKIGPEDFVLQCRRCVTKSKTKDKTAPDQALCQQCKEPGLSCRPWRARKSTTQEQKEREENGGEDPITKVGSELINNADNVLFRCTSCSCAFHYEHLPPRILGSTDAQRFNEYAQDWMCKVCLDAPGKPDKLVAWKPVDENNYDPSQSGDTVEEDDKLYLVKWQNKSYLRCSWMPGAWVWGIVGATMRLSFFKREDDRLPKMRFEDAISEDLLRADIVLDVRYTSIVDAPIMEVDKARIKEVDEALIKYKGLGYEDAVWEKPPSPHDEERWSDFVNAYNYWVLGNYVHQPKPAALEARLEKARGLDFATKLEKKAQPSALIGGELMKYQLEGINWLFYKWYTEKNAILADEMGLGKTIQIIGLLATLVQDWNCFPFLIVVPNATCANWRREIQKWAPSLRVVAYFGSAAARELAYRYELFPKGRKELRCHIVVTSYEAAIDDQVRFFKSVPWQAVIVDEGQRLKNDSSLIYGALSALSVPFKILMTGTPLQNNARELFNLLQFLDPKLDAAQLEKDYEVLDSAKIAELHEMIRPFFLRRTKAQVLTFLPPMAQVIVPVSMSTVTKKLYRSILARNPDLIRVIFTDKNVRASDRGNLNNILMQLRKCLCHPFVYSQNVEDRNVSQAASHRNLVEASGKLQLLGLLLPKLNERGHRVLIFSQFLNMLDIIEDFLGDLGLNYARLDGSMGSLAKQKRIDAFNAPDSNLFAFLLSTRAGGVGINLATADTVIILDPDFNPHQDIQALSRAHRIGQTKKVSCYQLVTRASAEEKILQIGRKKMALDHVLVDQMDAEDANEKDLESILRHGAEEIFDDNGEKDVKYDADSIDKLLDRAETEDTPANGDKSAESLFSRARIWANDDLSTSLEASEAENVAPNASVWDKILHEREKIAAAEAAAAETTFGRGRRRKATVDYIEPREAGNDLSPAPKRAMQARDSDNDTDFRSSDGEESDEDENVDESLDRDEPALSEKPKSKSQNVQAFQRAKITTPMPNENKPSAAAIVGIGGLTANARSAPLTSLDPRIPVFDYAADVPRRMKIVPMCIVCNTAHESGHCPIRIAGIEHCNLCGMAHYASAGHRRVCPHMSSETQVRAMLAALKNSPEPAELVQLARTYLVGVKGSIVVKKKRDMEKVAGEKGSMASTNGTTDMDTNHERPYDKSMGMMGGPGQSHDNITYGAPTKIDGRYIGLPV